MDTVIAGTFSVGIFMNLLITLVLPMLLFVGFFLFLGYIININKKLKNIEFYLHKIANKD